MDNRLARGDGYGSAHSRPPEEGSEDVPDLRPLHPALHRCRAGAEALSLAAGLVLGAMLGLVRMAEEGHFLSDTIWSGLIAFGVAHALSYYLLRIPAREDSVSTLYPHIERDGRCRISAITGAAVLGLGILIVGSVASPHYADLFYRTTLSAYPARPEVVEITAHRLDVELVLVPGDRDRVRESTGKIRGFGLPTTHSRSTGRIRHDRCRHCAAASWSGDGSLIWTDWHGSRCLARDWRGSLSASGRGYHR